MVKKAFTTRFDESVLALAERVAAAERRSVTSVLEVALLDYADRKGINLDDPRHDSAAVCTGD